MFRLKSFHEDDLPTLHMLMQEHFFAALVTQQPETGLFITHLPFALDTTRGRYGTLMAHMARPNPQWRDFANEQETLVLFQGSYASISSSEDAEGIALPTWSHAVIHAYGKPRLVEDRTKIYHMLEVLEQRVLSKPKTAGNPNDLPQVEAELKAPWVLKDLSEDAIYQKISVMVAFEMEITRLEGKFKVSESLPQAADPLHAVAAL